MVFKKLLQLLRKDALLLFRSQLWTVFETVLPLLLVVAPALLIMALTRSYGDQIKNYGYSVSEQVSLDDGISVECDGRPKAFVDYYWDDRPLRWERGTIKLGPKQDRFEYVEKARSCSGAVYIVEANRSTTIAMAKQGEEWKRYGFAGHNYYMNKVFYAFYEAHQQNIPNIEFLPTQPIRTFSPFPDNELHSLPESRQNGMGDFIRTVFPLIFGLCLTMPVIAATRNLLVEKESVKPYLSTIGLPIWLFYLEHFVFGVIKTTFLITLTSIVWIFCVPGFPGYVCLGIFFYTLNCVAFAIFASTLIPSAKRAVEAMVLIWLSLVVITTISHPVRGTWMWIAPLNPNSALKYYLDSVLLAHDVEKGMAFGELFRAKNMGAYPAAVYLGYMLGNTIWMFVAAIFMDKLFSFVAHFFLKYLWGVLKGSKKSRMSSRMSRAGGDKSTILNVQEKLDGRSTASADIELSGLVKVYPNGEKAVNGLSLRAVRGQVSILLGHNGCGKSTTFGMITGMHKATEGKILIGGVDAKSNRSETRKLIGYCPQYNPLYDKLTVMEHLRLVHALKGGHGDFKQDALSLLEQIELTDKKDTLAKNLSGGMKRKLCVCMAMIGGSRVILLDEPTAGMDPAARIDVQKMLTKVKAERTILLTTHYMDEAEKLGDWVFVMSHGKMAASGSIHYLKQKYGGGMLLTLVFKPSKDHKKSYEAAHRVCQAICPTASVKDERGQMMEISIAEREKAMLPKLFRALEAIAERNFNSSEITSLGPEIQNQAQQLDLVTVGVSMSSLEQVFIKIGDECDAIINKSEGTDTKKERRKKFAALITAKKQPPKQGFSKTWMVLVALLQKRFYYLYRNPIQIFLQILLPLGTLWLFANTFSAYVSSEMSKNRIQFESLDLSEFPSSSVVVQRQNTGDDRLLKYLYEFSNFNIMEADYDLSIQKVVEKYSMGFQQLGFVIKVRQDNVVAIYFQEPSETSEMPDTEQKFKNKAILINLLSSALYLRSTYVTELPRISSQIYWMMDKQGASKVNLQELIFSLPMYTLLIGGIIIQSIVYLIEERVCKFTHQQYLTGLSTFTYWGVVFLWDFLLFTFFVLYILIFILAFGVFEGHVGEVVLLFYCLLLYLAPLVYLLSNLINSPTKGSFLVYIFLIVTYFTGAILFVFMIMNANMDPRNTNSDDNNGKKTGVKYGVRSASPSFGFIMGIIKIAAICYEHSGLTIHFDGITGLWEYEALLIEFMFILCFALLLTSCLCCTTLKPIRRTCFSMTHRKSKPKSRVQYKGFETCEAVKEEEALIPNIDKQGKVIVVDGLIKDFGSFRAVNGLSVSVGHEECFGMLGANGAGKTTTFDIITGLTMPTGGNVTIEGKDITKNIHIGYCPQFDAMLQQISCRQTLSIMAKLQGYPNVKEVVELVLECVGMKEHGNKLVKNCSGGQKRKISVGIALMSRANCIILDEPTAGIDPRARREIWDIIHEMREQAKCSIVLTSHSMEECEALCTRIGILRKGEMIALGTSQSLKSQYGHTYMMTLVLYQLKDRDAVVEKVKQEMPSSVLKTPESSLTTSLVWEIPKSKSDKWSEKYSEVEALAKKANAKDYMLAQSSLEDTFIRLITTE